MPWGRIPLPTQAAAHYMRPMTQNPPSLRPDLAPRALIKDAPRPGQPTIGMVSL